jgi:hypothetical protein
VAIKPEKTKNAGEGKRQKKSHGKEGEKTQGKEKEETGNHIIGGRDGEKPNQGKFWSINQQHFVLLPPLSPS